MVEIYSTRDEKELAYREFLSNGGNFLYIYGPPATGKTYIPNHLTPDEKTVWQFEWTEDSEIHNLMKNINCIRNWSDSEEKPILIVQSIQYYPIIKKLIPSIVIMEFEGKET